MTTYLQQRVERLNRAINNAPEQGQADLIPQLQNELDQLQAAEEWEVSDRTYLIETAVALWNWKAQGLGPLPTIQKDPTLAALGEAPVTTPEINALTMSFATEEHSGTLHFLQEVRDSVTNEAAFAEMVIAAHRNWLMSNAPPRPYPYDDVGVLLPVRIETLIDDDTHTLFLRVIPDEASIRRDHPNVTPFEIESLNELWRDIRSGIPDPTQPLHTWLTTDGGKAAWQRFSGRFSPQRAAWLISTFLPTPETIATEPTVEVPAELVLDKLPMTNHVGGFPKKIGIWIAFGDDPTPQPLEPMTVKTDLLEIDIKQQKEMLGVLDGSTPMHDDEQAWWITWEGAVAVGLGVERPLPPNCNAANITAIYVAGSSEESPAEHFRSKINTGEMAILPLGVPTNTVHGQAAAPLDKDADIWLLVAQERVKAQVAPDDYKAFHPFSLADLSLSLTGDTYVLPYLSGVTIGLRDTPLYSNQMVQALWSALWGHYLRDLWQWGERNDLLGLWASENLFPEGPLPPIRIDQQPYGLLPVSAFSRWAVTASDGEFAEQVEPPLVELLLNLRPGWANLARNQNKIDLKTTDHLIELLSRDGVTHQYLYRYFLPAELYAMLYSSYMDPVLPLEDIPAFMDVAWRPYKDLRDLMQSEPVRPYLSLGYYDYLRLPLVEATRMPHIKIADILKDLENRTPISTVYIETMHNILPDSLLVRLMIYAYEVGQASVGQTNVAGATLINPPTFNNFTQNNGDTQIENLRQRFAPNDSHTMKLFENAANALFILAEELDGFLIEGPDPLEEQEIIYRMELSPSHKRSIERTLRATLDTAAFRIDPWFTGMAWRRLRTSRQQPSAAFRMGIYGWVDGPIVGSPGPTTAGRLHSPSYSQALTSIILRDKYISSSFEGDADETNQWRMSLDSALIRLANEFAEEARMGSHIYEILGRHVEQIIGTHAGIQAARKKFPLRLHLTRANPAPNTPCNGYTAMQPGALDDVVALDDEQKASISQIKAAFDVYGDLLMTEAVHQVVTGHSGTAGAAMDAASGFAQPPTTEFVDTPNAGYTLKTNVLMMIPRAEMPAVVDASTSPALLSDPSVALYLEQSLGGANEWTWDVQWTWQTNAGEQREQVDNVKLAELDLLPIDTASFSDDVLGEIVVARSQARMDFMDADLETLPQAKVATPKDRHSLARQIVMVLGNQPASASDLMVQEAGSAEAATWVAALNNDVRIELLNRYRLIREAAQQVINLLNAADAPTRKNGLRSALRWGVGLSADATIRAAALRMIFAAAPPADLTDFDMLTATAAAALTNRLNSAPDPDQVIAPDAVGSVPQERLLRFPHDIALAIAELASQDGKLAVLSVMNAALVQAKTTVTPHPELNEDWLSVVATVREKLAKLEAWQLETEFDPALESLTSWSSSSDDPWLTSAVKALNVARQADKILRMPRFIAAYVSANALANTEVAVGVMDSWTEMIPTAGRSTTAAFGFNAPAARPQQTILIAVPPQTGIRLTDDLLLQTLIETRELAHARAARFDGGLNGFVPSTVFEGTPSTGVRLDNDTHVKI